jgi:two-component system nitrate/nitrite response regulator NarL
MPGHLAPVKLLADMSTRVLIIDDHAVVRDILRAQLAEAGLDVVGEAADLDEGLRQARFHRPEIIVLDAVLPQTNGLEAIIALTEALPGTQVVYLGDDPSRRYADAALEAGAAAYIFKDEADTTTAATVLALVAAQNHP